VRRFFVVILLITLILPATGFNVYATQEESGQGIDGLQEEIAEYEEMLKLLEQDIEDRLQRLESLNAKLEEKERELVETRNKLVESQQRLEKKNNEFGNRVRSAYMSGGASYLEILLEAESFGDLIVNLTYLTRVLNGDAELISAIREEHQSIEQQKNVLEEQRQEVEDQYYAVEAERRNLEEEQRKVDRLLAAAQEELAHIPQTERDPVYGVAMDNHANARPQHGLSQASVVYEYEVEGRITRYLALFYRLPNKVGPIRSAREHNIMLAWENNVNFIHAGGSRDNIERIQQWGVSATDALAHPAFYRDSSRWAPHNLYVNLSTLNRGTPSLGVVERPGSLDRQGRPATKVSVSYSPSYHVSYTYDTKQHAYRRLINNSPHLDATGEPILARNIIIQYVGHPTDSYGRPTPQVVGEGNIDYYANGQHYTGTWQKDSPSSPTQFYYEDGQEIERVSGQTWIQLARP